MKVLVTAASKHGGTNDIAIAIGEELRAAGLEVMVAEPAQVIGLDGFDAVILGSAVYAGRWLGDARDLIERCEPALRDRAVWLFSSGPIGEDLKPVGDPADVPEIMTSTRARGHRVFAGRLVRDRLGFVERAVVTALRAPDGDFRDWAEIRSWARSIAHELLPAMPPVLA
jgi:menaquinone-dependent protoporphyrinogen oxidase